MSDLTSGGIGFASAKDPKKSSDVDLDQKIYRTAVEAARRKLTPEFMNRIDRMVVFRSLTEHHLRRILDLELQAVQDRIMKSARTKFLFDCSDGAKDLLLNEGIDLRYGARHLKRAIERLLVYPLSNLVATEQVGFGDLLSVDIDRKTGELIFSKSIEGSLILDTSDSIAEPERITAPLTDAWAAYCPMYSGEWFSPSLFNT
jgi:ATP-dependent Clp protease ATP-binding subunit ClpB